MRPLGLLLAAFFLASLSFLGPPSQGQVSKQDRSYTTQIGKRCTVEVTEKLGALAQKISNQRRDGTFRVNDANLRDEADTIAETALALASEAREHWCDTEGEPEFNTYVTISHNLLSADAAAEYVRTGDPQYLDLAAMELKDGALAVSLATTALSHGK